MLGILDIYLIGSVTLCCFAKAYPQQTLCGSDVRLLLLCIIEYADDCVFSHLEGCVFMFVLLEKLSCFS